MELRESNSELQETNRRLKRRLHESLAATEASGQLLHAFVSSLTDSRYRSTLTFRTWQAFQEKSWRRLISSSRSSLQQRVSSVRTFRSKFSSYR